jgi:activating signal cointegrator 1
VQVYDLRDPLSSSMAAGVALLNGGGRCIFCGNPLPLAQRAASAAGLAGASDPVDTARSVTADAAAREFAARLVDFDRNAAKRTAVIDDQGDWFEIESNQWLTREERQQLQERQALEEELEKQRRSRVTVSVDLIGRQVLVELEASFDSRREQSCTALHSL